MVKKDKCHTDHPADIQGRSRLLEVIPYINSMPQINYPAACSGVSNRDF